MSRVRRTINVLFKLDSISGHFLSSMIHRFGLSYLNIISIVSVLVKVVSRRFPETHSLTPQTMVANEKVPLKRTDPPAGSWQGKAE